MPPHQKAHIARTIRQHAIDIFGADNADSRMRDLIAKFKSRTKAVEHGLADSLEQAAGDTVTEKIEDLEKVPVGTRRSAHARGWERLLAQQYKLFNDYYLWTDPAQAFAAFTS